MEVHCTVKNCTGGMTTTVRQWYSNYQRRSVRRCLNATIIRRRKALCSSLGDPVDSLYVHLL